MRTKKNILILGTSDQFGEKIIAELVLEDNTILLCGDDQSHQQRMIQKHPRHVKVISSVNSLRNYKQIQSAIEVIGSLDAVIYLVGVSNTKSFLEQSSDQVSEIFNTNLIAPVCLLQALYPYLRKANGCKVMFIDTDVFTGQGNNSVAHLASHYGLWGFCEGIKEEFQTKGIEVKSISSPAMFYSAEAQDLHGESGINSQHYKNVMRKIREMLRSAGKATIPSPGNLGEPLVSGHTS